MKSALFICLLGIAITLAFGASATDGRSKKRRLPGARIPLENSGGLAEAVLDSIQAQNVQEQLHHTKRWCRGCTYPLEGDGNQAEMVQKRIEKVQKEESAQTVTPDVQDADSKQRRKRETGYRDAPKKGKGKGKGRKRKPNTTSIYHPFSGTGDQASAVQQRLNSKLQKQPSFLLL
nr:PREDICTED: uncharacterized protein LOC107078252 isoform X3 [Lepisosteus oculatus]